MDLGKPASTANTEDIAPVPQRKPFSWHFGGFGSSPRSGPAVRLATAGSFYSRVAVECEGQIAGPLALQVIARLFITAMLRGCVPPGRFAKGRATLGTPPHGGQFRFGQRLIHFWRPNAATAGSVRVTAARDLVLPSAANATVSPNASLPRAGPGRPARRSVRHTGRKLRGDLIADAVARREA